MNRISSITIVKNDEANISDCIDSLKKCVDEVIVLVDSSSTDRTLEIVKSISSIKYEEVQWQGFSLTKQYAISLSTNDYILWLDSDEVLSANLILEINKLKEVDEISDAYSIPRRAIFLGKWIKHSGWYPGRVIRLFNKNNASFNDNKVHEGLKFISNTIPVELKNDIIHYTDRNLVHYLNKLNTYTSLAAEDLVVKGKAVSLLDIIFRPFWIFIKMYLIKAGFLDGMHGFLLASYSSFYVFVKYTKLWELKQGR
ncbi:MAG: glycosyltransferase family 2 protein [Ignavibacteriaceae bacterium]|jgi:(heptosyl)LPS beta-1,4-glucosyltransferase|nr:glycosyltransferase family 2 protein [Ignavibacteriaceae bacterium]